MLMRGFWIMDSLPEPPPPGAEDAPILRFTAERGYFYWQLEAQDADGFFHGDMLIRDGVWSSDTGLVYGVQGIEVAPSSRLLLLAYPRSDARFGNFSLSELHAEANGSEAGVVGALQRLLRQPPRARGGGAGAEKCPLLFELHWEAAVPADSAGLGAEAAHWEGWARCSSCALVLEVEHLAPFSLDAVAEKANNYAVFATLVNFGLVRLMVFHMTGMTSVAALARVSPAAFFGMAVLDAYYCMGHLTVALALDGSFLHLSLTTFLIFVLFSVFEIGHVIMVLRARAPDAFATAVEARRRISVIYARFYAVILAGFVLFYLLQSLAWLLLLLLHAFWLPQIVENAVRCSRRSLSLPFVWGATALRLLPPAYFLLCPENFLALEPQPALFLLLAAFLAAQAAVLTLQVRKGPRFLVPALLLKALPPHYNYWREFEPDPERASPFECVICMDSCDPAQPGYSAVNMVTPCNHIFHEDCLRQWLEQQLKCPTCRHSLPVPLDSTPL